MDEQGTSQNLTDRLIGLIHNISEEKKEQLLQLLLEWQKNEQRGDQRVPCLIPVDFSTQDRVYRDFIQNFSNGGVFIETRENLAPGQPVSLTFSAPNSQNHFKIIGTILRSEDRGVAVQFERKLSRYQEEIIKNTPNR
jgi:Tfp pilus assembly protein PilZ